MAGCRRARPHTRWVKVRSPDERPPLGRDIRGRQSPHVAISREERDLAHAGYEASLLDRAPIGHALTWAPGSNTYAATAAAFLAAMIWSAVRPVSSAM